VAFELSSIYDRRFARIPVEKATTAEAAVT
jgi:hypothetical protein